LRSILEMKGKTGLQELQHSNFYLVKEPIQKLFYRLYIPITMHGQNQENLRVTPDANYRYVMPESEKAKRKLIRTIAKEVAYEVLFEHLEEYEHVPKPKKADEEHREP
jgi:hypothetical protein